MIGILPLYSHRKAEFLTTRCRGMRIPDDIRSGCARRTGRGAQVEASHAQESASPPASGARRLHNAAVSTRWSVRSA